jgi:predicted nucleotidyltransferase
MRRIYDPALDEVLDPLVADLHEVFGADLIGLYLYGSAVSGGFDPGVSDLDLIAITRREMADLDLSALNRVHGRVTDRDPSWTDRLEVVYVARGTLASGSSSRDPLAVISPGEPFHVTGPASDWIQNWYLARETGISLVGPEAAAVIPSISSVEFLAAVRSYLRYLRDQAPSAYAVLSACRAARTLETGIPCSKQEGAAWLREGMPEWAWLIDQALACRLSGGALGLDDEPTREAATQFVTILASKALSPPKEV